MLVSNRNQVHLLIRRGRSPTSFYVNNEDEFPLLYENHRNRKLPVLCFAFSGNFDSIDDYGIHYLNFGTNRDQLGIAVDSSTDQDLIYCSKGFIFFPYQNFYRSSYLYSLGQINIPSFLEKNHHIYIGFTFSPIEYLFVC